MKGLWAWVKGWLRGPDRSSGGLDCEAVMARLYEYIDEELDDPQTVQAIRDHLELCERCHPQYRFEKAFLRFISEHGRNSAPPELRQKVFERILEEERDQ